VNYLRNGRKDLPAFESRAKYQLFEEELEFWTLKDDLVRLRKAGKPSEIQAKQPTRAAGASAPTSIPRSKQ